MIGLVGLAVAVVAIAALAVLGRWTAGLPFGARRLKDALTPWGDEGPSRAPLAIARAIGGVSGWYLGAALVFAFAMTIQGRVVYDETGMRVKVAVGGPADTAGIRDGDRIVSLDGETIRDWDQLKRAVGKREEGDRMRVTIDREGSTRDVVVVPVKVGGVTKMLVGPAPVKTKIGFGSAFVAGSKMPLEIMANAIQGIGRILVGSGPVEATGPVGIVREVSTQRAEPFSNSMTLGAALASYVWPLVVVVSAVFALVASRRRLALNPSPAKS